MFPCLLQSTGSERIGFTSNTLIILRDVYQYKQTAFGLKISTFAKHSFAGDVLISTVSGRWKLYEIDSDNNVYGDEYDDNDDENKDGNTDDDGDDIGGDVGDDGDVGDWRWWQRKASVASLMLAKSLSQWRSTWLYIIIITRPKLAYIRQGLAGLWG